MNHQFLEDIANGDLDTAIKVIDAAIASCGRVCRENMEYFGITDPKFINAYENFEAANQVKRLLLVARNA